MTDCPRNDQGLPIQPDIEKDLMEDGFLDFANKEGACESEDECEQIVFTTSTIQEVIPGEDCRPFYEAQGIPFPSDERSLEERYANNDESSHSLVNNRWIQRRLRRKKTRVKKRYSGRCRSRRGKCRRSKKRRVLRASFDNSNGSMTLNDGQGDVRTYSLRRDSSSAHNGKKVKSYEPAETRVSSVSLPMVPMKYRSLQVVPTVNIGDLTPEECANISIAKSILEQDPDRPSFRTIVKDEEQEYVESITCESDSEECALPSGGYACCGVGSCLCDIGSETRCNAGTSFVDESSIQCYINANGTRGDVSSRQDNLCCGVDTTRLQIAYLYECASSVCGPLPEANCIQQPWTTSLTQGPPTAREGSFRTQVTFDIFDICNATLSNSNDVRTIMRSTIERYMREILDESNCDGFIRVTSVTINNIDTSRCTKPELCTDPMSGQQGHCVGVNSLIQGTFSR